MDLQTQMRLARKTLRTLELCGQHWGVFGPSDAHAVSIAIAISIGLFAYRVSGQADRDAAIARRIRAADDARRADASALRRAAFLRPEMGAEGPPSGSAGGDGPGDPGHGSTPVEE